MPGRKVEGIHPEDLGIGKLFERIRDAVIVADAKEGRIVLWNPAATKMFGYSSSEALGMRVEALVPEALKARHRAGMARYGETGYGLYIDSPEPLELPASKKNGEEIYIELSLSPLEPVGETGGSGRFVLAIVRDITGRKRAEEDIRRLNQSLEKRVADRTAQLIEQKRQLKELVGKLLTAQEEERRRVAYEIHDGLTQVAISAHQHLQAFADGHPSGSKVDEGELDRAVELAQRVAKESRCVIEGLRPSALDDFGLGTAIRQMVKELKAEGWWIVCEETLGEERLSTEIETAFYRVAQEALTNVRKHAWTTRARVVLARLGPKVRLEVSDEGRGFDPAAVSRNGGPGEKIGLSSMQERLSLLGGELKISSKPGAGTSLVAEAPLLDVRENGGRP